MVLLPDARLFEASAPIAVFDDELRSTALDMIDMMHQSRGIGLAGVQVGFMKRLFVVHVENDQPRVFINPLITDLSDRITAYEEGCLSIPGVYANVDRPDALRVQALNEQGEPFTLEAEGLLARVIQHEYDHLDGRLFYQHLGPRQQTRFLRAYERSLQGEEV